MGRGDRRRDNRERDELATSRLELTLMLVSLILGGASIWLSSWDPLWRALHVNVQLRSSLGSALSVVLLLAGFLPALYLQNNRLTRHVTVETENIVHKLQTAIPHLTALEIVSSNAAFELIVERLAGARAAWNTRIAGYEAVAEYNTPESKRYRRNLVSAIRKGLVFREVVSQAWTADAAALKAEIERGRASGSYRYVPLLASVPSFLNFIVIEDKSGARETFCGWIISETRGFEQICMRFRDGRVAEYFLGWYNELHLRAQDVKPTAAPAPAREAVTPVPLAYEGEDHGQAPRP